MQLWNKQLQSTDVLKNKKFNDFNLGVNVHNTKSSFSTWMWSEWESGRRFY